MAKKMKPQILIGLTVSAMYALSACSQNSPRMASPQKTSQVISHHSSHTLKARQAVRQRQVARRRQVNLQRHVAPQVRVVPQQFKRPALHHQSRIFQQFQPAQPQRLQPAQPQQQMVPGMPGISVQEVRTIGDKIFQNESGGDINKLVHWNKGEDFAAMGIGHFTWYPAGRRQSFGNTFPGVLTYLESRGVRLPQWVQRAKYTGAPWRTRAQLMRDKNNPQVQQLQRILYETRYLQAEYIMQRAQRAMPKLVTTAPPYLRPMVAGNLNAVANSRGGWYPLIDYVNFKGEGLNRHGGYKRQNWGLLQVLEEMRPASPGAEALNEFANAAMRVLERRVRNAPRSRNEQRWLAGWNNRISTYRQAS